MLYKDDAPARQRASSSAGQFPLKKRTRPGPFASLHDPFRPRRVASLAPVLQAAGEAGDGPIGDRPPSYRLSLAAENKRSRGASRCAGASEPRIPMETAFPAIAFVFLVPPHARWIPIHPVCQRNRGPPLAWISLPGEAHKRRGRRGAIAGVDNCRPMK
jgi:hypothetical protein